MKTAEVVANAVGGVLFIDEAYGLTGDQYGQEAVDTLVKEMEDHRDDLVVIVAGYPEPDGRLHRPEPRPGQPVPTTIEFDDYSDDELRRDPRLHRDGADYELTDDARRRVRHQLEATPRTPAFGNGRFSRNLFEHAVGRHAWRLQGRDGAESRRPASTHRRRLHRAARRARAARPPRRPRRGRPGQPQDPATQDPAEVRADPDGPAGTDEAVSDAQDEPHDPSANEHEDTA